MEPPKKRRRGPFSASGYYVDRAEALSRENRAAETLQNKFRFLVKGVYQRSPEFVHARSARIQRHEHSRFIYNNPILNDYRFMATHRVQLAEPLVQADDGEMIPNHFAFAEMGFDENGNVRPLTPWQLRRKGRDHLAMSLYDAEYNRHSMLANRYVSLVERAVDRRADRRRIEAGERLLMSDEDINTNV